MVLVISLAVFIDAPGNVRSVLQHGSIAKSVNHCPWQSILLVGVFAACLHLFLDLFLRPATNTEYVHTTPTLRSQKVAPTFILGESVDMFSILDVTIQLIRVAFLHGTLVELWSDQSGIRMESGWNQGGIGMESEWNQGGIRLESEWNQGGIRVESEWNRSGIRLESGWN